MKSNTRFSHTGDELQNRYCSVVSAAVVGGTALVGGAMQANAAKKAASSQSKAASAAADSTLQAARESNALNWTMYQQQLQNQKPYMQGGQTAYAALLGGMGLQVPTGSGVAGSASGGYGLSPDDPSYGMPLDNGAGGGTGAGYSTYIDGIGEIGVQDLNADNNALQNAAFAYKNKFSDSFTPSDITLDPSYQFRLQQGMRALENSAAARGLTGSGQNLADIQDYAQGLASTEYGNAWNRYQTEQTNLFNRLSSLAGTGQTATNTAGQAAQQAGQTIGSNTMSGAQNAAGWMTQGANASAAGTINSAGAWANGLTGAANGMVGVNYLSNGKLW